MKIEKFAPLFFSFFIFSLFSLTAVAKEYSFEVQEKFINITFESAMDVEDIVGTSNSAKGFLKWDGKSAASFKISVPVASLKTGIDMRDEHLRGEYWLDASKHPEIVFEGTSLEALGGSKYKISGKFTLKGVTRPLSFEVDLRELPASVASAQGMGDKAWLRIRGGFTVKLSDYGILIPDMAAAKVNDSWTIKLSVFAQEQ